MQWRLEMKMFKFFRSSQHSVRRASQNRWGRPHGTNYSWRGHDKEHFSRLFMGASLSGSCYNYCSSLDQPASRWQIQQTGGGGGKERERKKKNELICPFWRVKYQKIKYHRKAQKVSKWALASSVQLTVYFFIYPLSSNYFSSPDRQQICTSTLTHFQLAQQNCTSLTLSLFFFFLQLFHTGAHFLPSWGKNLAWRWNDCLTLH